MRVTISDKTEIVIQDKDGQFLDRFLPTQVSSQTTAFGDKLLVFRKK